jgi:beta-glucosidase
VPGDFAIGGAVHVNVEPPHGTDDEELARAVELAAASDVVVLVVGTTEEVESEGYDRRTLALPGRQDELVRRVADVNRRTVVVVNSGAPVLLPWADDVTAVLLAWFPGQEFGDALADVLLGAAEPGGRLPTTWPVDERSLPSPTPVDGRLEYSEGLSVGYRDAARSARFPFGHGLGYTTWEYVGVSAVVAPTSDADGRIEVTVRNSGSRRGREVVQVYLSRPGSSVARPARWLAGFAGVVADPGEEVTVTVPLAARSVQHWDVATHRWATEVGHFVVEAGGSVAALPVGEVLDVR